MELCTLPPLPCPGRVGKGFSWKGLKHPGRMAQPLLRH